MPICLCPQTALLRRACSAPQRVLRVQPRATATVVAAAGSASHVLYTVPVSNFGARPRLVLLWKGIPATEVEVASPQALGGLKSAEYLALNPQGKMPLLRLPDGTALFESEVIVSYLLDVFSGRGPSLLPDTPAARARMQLLTRLHDVYLAPHQPAMYKAMEAAPRAASLAELSAQLDILESMLHATGPYSAGPQLSTADAALFPTFVFYTTILPAVYSWQDIFTKRPRLARWWAAMCKEPSAAAVKADIEAGLQKWKEDDRWGKARRVVCFIAASTDTHRFDSPFPAARHHGAVGRQQLEVGTLTAPVQRENRIEN
jgi:glutathione S-transferase